MDVQCMSRRELLVFGATLVLCGIGFAGAFAITAYAAQWLRIPMGEQTLAVNVVMFLFAWALLYSGMGLIGGTCMLMRGAFRRSTYVPDGWCQDCIASGRGIPAAERVVAADAGPWPRRRRKFGAARRR